jgi:hypothetical protein
VTPDITGGRRLSLFPQKHPGAEVEDTVQINTWKMGWFKNGCLFVIAVSALFHVLIDLVGFQIHDAASVLSPEMQRMFV